MAERPGTIGRPRSVGLGLQAILPCSTYFWKLYRSLAILFAIDRHFHGLFYT
jgi:hypothetical protein